MSKIRRLTESGMLIALAVILSLLKVYNLPYGGSITLCSMLPIIVIGYRYGSRWGLLSGLVYGVLQMMLGAVEGVFKGTGIGIVLCVILFDYLIAFAVLGLGGMFKGKIRSTSAALALGTIVVSFLRLAAHFISGYLFFGSYAELVFLSGGVHPWSDHTLKILRNPSCGDYSLFYNASYMIPEMIITAAVAAILGAALKNLGDPQKKLR